MLLVHKELCPQVFLLSGLMVEDGQTADAGQDEVFGNLVRQRFERDQEDVCRSQPVLSANCIMTVNWMGLLFLRLHTPETNLTIVQGDLICSIQTPTSARSPSIIQVHPGLPALIDWSWFSCDAILVACSHATWVVRGWYEER